MPQVTAGGRPFSFLERVPNPVAFGLAKGAGVDFAFFLFLPVRQNRSTRPHDRSTLIFYHSLQNT
jgi:hypothetical protein